jgi:catechol 2,3-dioxygenase-like lactoylglutathione lyase family enzyme
VSLEPLFDGIEVGIVTTRPQVLADFYGGFLGLEARGELEFAGGRQLRFGAGPNTIKLLTYDDPPAAGPVPGGGPAQAGIRYLSLGAANLAEVAADAVRAGIDVLVPPTDFPAFPGFGFCFLADPDGNAVELFGPLATD